MSGTLRAIIEAEDEALRGRSLEEACAGKPLDWLLAECADLDRYRRSEPNLYKRVRALFFLHGLHRYLLPDRADLPRGGRIPWAGQAHLLDRRFDEALSSFLGAMSRDGPSDPLCSALAEGYRALGFQSLADQVRRSVRGVRGNQWMFRVGHPADHPLRIRPEMLHREGGAYPVLRERVPVRMDLTHSAWSDIFFLGMDYPEGARVLNVSVGLGVRGRDGEPRPPVEAYLRVVGEPVLRLASIDLGETAEMGSLAEVFDFAKDHLGLLKAAVIASGLVPPGLEGSGRCVQEVLAAVVGPGLGLEIASSVRGIPKGSRLAVSTNLLAGLVSAIMRATGQTRALEGTLEEGERRLVAARAILGEWLGGSGGGWQDSGGVWPGIKLIEGVRAAEGDPECGTGRGRLLPRHTVLGEDEIPAAARRALQDSLVLVHGGLAQNVGPILEMVTEKYLLRSPAEWEARQEALRLLDAMLAALRAGDMKALGEATTRNFRGPIQRIIPWASNAYTERLIEEARRGLGNAFWGFWMLGGMAGGGMGFIVAPERKAEAQGLLQEAMLRASEEMGDGLPFAMRPVVYDFAVDGQGAAAELLRGADSLMPQGYYALQAPAWLRADPRGLPPARHEELSRFGAACRDRPEMAGGVEALFERLFPKGEGVGDRAKLDGLLSANGFDQEQHERLRADLLQGRIGLAQNRLPATVAVEDAWPGDVVEMEALDGAASLIGERSLAAGEAAVLTLAGGAGSRWSGGAGTVKALHPFCRMAGRHRTFLELALAKTRRSSILSGAAIPHLVSTGYLTHGPIERVLARPGAPSLPGGVVLSPGKAIGQRLVPMGRDLLFAWNESKEQRLDAQAQKVRDSSRAALLEWVRREGEASDYVANAPSQCVHPLGHWHEVPNLLRNGALARLLAERPSLRHLFVHNLDATGAGLDAALLGAHIASGSCMTFEVVRRRIDDQGGGLARIDGRLRLVEGLALARPEDESRLGFYNTLSHWIDIDQLLAVFGLERRDLADGMRTAEAVARVADRMPTYVTLKEVKKRWGNGQEDAFPVSQAEKLWGDMTVLPGVACGYVAVTRRRGRQLKDPAQLDGWLRDGGAAYAESLCEW
ncbi:MAG: UTP--glucose-1-phosphate uridylyltransferase [Gemmataceae bacterium]|nr:UTP--glucose-1-phosphate uridylyltransferase [Gemmataceae bacterium]